MKMLNKKLAVGILLGVVLAAGAGYLMFSDDEKEEFQPQIVVKKDKEKPSVNIAKTVSKPVIPIKKADLYNSVNKNLPLSAISYLSELSPKTKDTVNNLLEESLDGIYYLNHAGDKIFVIADLNQQEEESVVKRHNFNFIEISATDGHCVNHHVTEPDSEYDKWEYKDELPLNHIHYNNNNELEYTETWNYSEDEPIKYKKTDKNNQIVSLRKEVVDNGVNLREEHIFYDEEGNMTKNVSFNYDGLDLTRFTYYDSQTPNDSAMIVSEFEDGVKKKETVYSSDYKIQNTYIPEYKDGQKSEIKILDKNNNLIETLQAE